MPDLRMHMPAPLSTSVSLATQVLDASVPPWAASRAALTLHHAGAPEHVAGHRALSDIFRLPNSSPAVRNWVYTRPDTEVVDEAALGKCAAESSTIFRFQGWGEDGSFEVSPTVSNHWLMVPVQSLNGVTVGLTYLDILYERVDGDASRVPPLRVGKFAIEDSTGEVFITGWRSDIMVVGWIQSILKCERVRELLMFRAPPLNGLPPRTLLVRNSFFERRDCKLCGRGPGGAHVHSMQELMQTPPCTGVRTASSRDPDAPPPLTNVSTLYRRFRGGYFGVCLKTTYAEGAVLSQNLASVFVDIRRGLYNVKQHFRTNLTSKIYMTMAPLFGLGPLASSRVFFLRADSLVDSTARPMEATSGKRKAGVLGACSRAPTCGDMSPVSSQRLNCSSQASSLESEGARVRRRRRVRGDDTAERDTPEFARKMRNRAAAEESNRRRREKQERMEGELQDLREVKKGLEEKLVWLTEERIGLYAELSKRNREGDMLEGAAFENTDTWFEDGKGVFDMESQPPVVIEMMPH